MHPHPRTYTIYWTSGETSDVLAINRMDAKDSALRIWAGSRIKTEVARVGPVTPTRAERRAETA